MDNRITTAEGNNQLLMSWDAHSPTSVLQSLLALKRSSPHRVTSHPSQARQRSNSPCYSADHGYNYRPSICARAPRDHSNGQNIAEKEPAVRPLLSHD